MEKIIIAQLAALAQTTRLRIFRLLVEQGESGLTPGQIASLLGLANATLSFHLKELAQAGLLKATPQGRFICYSVDFTNVRGLLDYLSENCCGGKTCSVKT